VRIVIICPFVGLEIDMELPEENRDVLEALDSLWARAEELLDRGLWTPSEAIRQEYHAMAAAVPPNRLTPELIRRPLAWWDAVAAETGDPVIERRVLALHDAWIQALRRIRFDQKVRLN
jgi:hypothetical protein